MYSHEECPSLVVFLCSSEATQRLEANLQNAMIVQPFRNATLFRKRVLGVSFYCGENHL